MKVGEVHSTATLSKGGAFCSYSKQGEVHFAAILSEGKVHSAVILSEGRCILQLY